MDELTGFQRDLLYVIEGLGQPHGLKVKDELEEYYLTEIHHGRLYPNLDTLVERDLVEKRKRDERTNSYEITGQGENVMEERREWENQYVEDTTS